MEFHQSNAEIFIPDGKPESLALRRVTHLGIGAHQDDLEFMAYAGILACIAREDQWFGGVTCTNGSGSPRSGVYAGYSDEQLMEIRRREQNAAAVIGRYGVMIQLDYPSSVVKDPTDQSLGNDLLQILTATQPEVVYTHNPADKHDTHLAVMMAAIAAIRKLPPAQRPQKVIGCEVWRDLDWLLDEDKVVMDVSGRNHLAAALNEVFDSQISGGKRYDLAIAGRRSANATLMESHARDSADQVIFGMNLTLLISDESLDIVEYVCEFIEKFHADVRQKLGALRR
ncbi:MAG: PIG-L family deacetylase [Akkermansiaceae bacterium]|nr:PIG-L family deacetylase [Akkermansiaceae bacterium]